MRTKSFYQAPKPAPRSPASPPYAPPAKRRAIFTPSVEMLLRTEAARAELLARLDTMSSRACEAIFAIASHNGFEWCLPGEDAALLRASVREYLKRTDSERLLDIVDVLTQLEMRGAA